MPPPRVLKALWGRFWAVLGPKHRPNMFLSEWGGPNGLWYCNEPECSMYHFFAKYRRKNTIFFKIPKGKYIFCKIPKDKYDFCKIPKEKYYLGKIPKEKYDFGYMEHSGSLQYLPAREREAGRDGGLLSLLLWFPACPPRPKTQSLIIQVLNWYP